MNTGNQKGHARVGLRGVILLFSLALIASCDRDTTGPLVEAPLLIAGGDMGAQFQNLTITRAGMAVTDGTVTVNGVVVPHAGAGRYVGQLPDAVPAGSPLNLQVSAGGVTVQGTVLVPEAPILTAPAAGAVLAAADYITVSWTSATDPDRFIVNGDWVVDDVAFRKTFPAAATARVTRISASELPAGADITLSVVAYNDGTFNGQADPDSRMSCGGGQPGAAITITTEASPLLVHGGVGAQHQSIWIFQGGWAITDGVSDAVVTVNGVTIPHAGGYPGYYTGRLPAAVPPGSPLDLRVRARGLIVEGHGHVPEAPVITAPATGAVLASRGSITVRWTSEASPDRFGVYVKTNKPVLDRQLPGAAREFEIVGSELPEGQFTISVVAFNDGRFSGPAHPASRMGIMSRVSSITLNR
jgi:hypothetical protein